MTRLGMLIDLKRCVGCDACTMACKTEHALPPGVFFARVYKHVSGKYPNVRGFFLPVLCNHCEEAPCIKSCPSGALYRTPEGIVLVDEEKCVGARACEAACPYGHIFFYEGNSLYFKDLGYETPIEGLFNSYRKENTAMKCNLCYHRIKEGRDPACVVVCPAECRIFGDLDDPESKPNKYLKEKRPGETPLPLRPETGARPKVLYLL